MTCTPPSVEDINEIFQGDMPKFEEKRESPGGSIQKMENFRWVMIKST